MTETLRGWRLLRWALPLLSLLPASIGIARLCTVTGPGDQAMEAGMELAFFFFPISFILALGSALVTWARRRAWPAVDKVVGFAPLFLFSAAVLVVVLSAVLRG